MKVLTITPWYPSEKDQMAGLFVQNFVDETTKLGANQVVFSETNVFAIIKGIFHYSKKKNRPDIVHLHVATKQGLIALFLQKWYDIPYLITEHWTGYYPENGSFELQVNRPIFGWVYKCFIKTIFKRARTITAVSEQFIEKLKSLGLISTGEVLYNIVPDFFAPVSFSSVEENHDFGNKVCHFINVTCFLNKAKNLTGIIDAIKIIREKEFIFTFVGDGKDKDMVTEYARSQGVDDKVEFVGEVEPKEVARLMREAGCLVLNSNYETACVVLQEALVAGLPIISTPVGIAPEYTDHIELIETGNPDMLAEAMSRFIDNPAKRYKGIEDFNNSPRKLYSMYETLLHSR